MACQIHSWYDWQCSYCSSKKVEDLEKEITQKQERWDKLKGIFQTIDKYCGDESTDVAFARGVLDEMKKLEGEG